MPESPSEDLPKKEDQELLYEKDIEIKNYSEKIQTLEAEVDELKHAIQIQEMKLQATDETDFQEVLAEFLKSVLVKRLELEINYNMTEIHIENLEFSYNCLKEKIENEKEIINGLKNNEYEMKKKIRNYSRRVDGWKLKIKDYKEHAEKTLAKAKLELITKEKEHLEVVTKLKSEILQGDAKIKELEMMLKNN